MGWKHYQTTDPPPPPPQKRELQISWGLFGVHLLILSIFQIHQIFKVSYFRQSRAIIGDRDRKSWDPRAHMKWVNLSVLTNCAILTSCIGADLRTCRGFSRRCYHVAWSNGEVCERFSCGFFTAMAGNKTGKQNKGSSMYFYALSKWKRWLFRAKNVFNFVLWMNKICSRWRKPSVCVCSVEKCKKTLYSDVELIFGFPKLCLIITKTCFW